MHTLELLREAKDILFTTMSAPVDTEMRRQLIPVAEPGAPTPEWADKLDKLDKRFYADSDNLTSRMKAFARAGTCCGPTRGRSLSKTGVGVEKRAPERDSVSVVSIAVYRSSSSEGYN